MAGRQCCGPGRHALHVVAVSALLLFISHVRADSSDFEIFRCPLSNVSTQVSTHSGYEYHCLSLAKRFVKGSSAGTGYFEGHYDDTKGRALVKWFNVSMVAGNPDRLQVQAGAGVITYASNPDGDKTVTWRQRWLGGDAPTGDRLEDAPAGTSRTCVKMDNVPALYSRVCMSAGDPTATQITELPEGLDGTVFTKPLDANGYTLGSSDVERQICHMGRSTISHYNGKLTTEECAALESLTANYTHGAISCEGNEGVHAGYFLPSSTLRFQGQGSLGLIGTWVATNGCLAGYRGSSVLLVSKHGALIKGFGSWMLLNAVHGGVMHIGSIEYQLALDSTQAPLRQPCDASKARGFTPIERFCDPEDAWGYINPWAPDTTTAPLNEVSSPSSLGPHKVLKCTGASAMRGEGENVQYHCIYKNTSTSRRMVSGSYGKYGYFQGEFDTASEAYVNFFEVTTSTGVARAASGAAVLKYNVPPGGDNMPVDMLPSEYWYTGTSSNAEGVGVWSTHGCEEVNDDAVAARMCMGPGAAVPADWAGRCQDEPGFMDSLGRTCHEWSQHPAWCEGSPEDGNYDPPSVYTNSDGVDPSQACCVCKQSSLPFAGTKWIRKGPDELHREDEAMGEVAFCSQAVNPLAMHSFRELTPSCTKRMVDEKRCPLTEFDNRTVRSDSLIFAGSVPGALGFAGVYDGAAESGHLLLALTSPNTLRGFSCTHGTDGNITRCKDVHFTLYQQDLACEGSVKSACKLINPDASLMKWSDLRPLRASNSFYTGGLGDLAKTGRTYKYGVWSCVRDWNTTQQLYCGSGPGRLVCFKYEDFTQTFQFWGLNADLRLVPKSEAEHTTFI